MMTGNNAVDEKRKYFDLDIRGLGYLNRVREVTPKEGTPFLSVTIAALRGPVDNAQLTHFDCVVYGQKAKEMVRKLAPAVAADSKVLIGFDLSDLQPETFTFTQGEREGSVGINLKSKLLRLRWAKVNGEAVIDSQTQDT